MQREQIELQGIQFPTSIREDGASVEITQLDSTKSLASKELDNWISDNYPSSDRNWGVIASARSKDEALFLVLSYKRVQRTKYKLQSGRLSKQQEEGTEPEIGEFHLRKDGLMELYCVPAKQKNMVFQSLGEYFGGDDKNIASPLFLSNEAMVKLMKDATEVSSVSLTGIGNPFFSDVTLSGSDPVNSRTYKELLSSTATIKSFRGKFDSDTPNGGSEADVSSLMIITVTSSCKIRFYGGQIPIAQSDIEDFALRVGKLAKVSLPSESA
jgi:hypothetical protein